MNRAKSELDPKQVFNFVGNQFNLKEAGRLAGPNYQDSNHTVRSSVPGPAVYVPHRSTHSNRKTSPPRSAPYETYTVTLEEQLEGTRVTGKDDTRSLHPHIKW